MPEGVVISWGRTASWASCALRDFVLYRRNSASEYSVP